MLKTPLKKLLNLFIHPKIRYFLISFLTVFLLFLIYFIYTYFVVKDIRLTVDDKTKVSGLYAFHNKNLLLLKTTEVEGLLLTQNPYIKSVAVQKQYPETLLIYIELLHPIAYLQTKEGYFILGENGRILRKERGETTQQPLMHYYQNFPYRNFQAGSYIENQDIVTALYFLQKLSEVGITIKTIDIEGFHMLGLYTGEKKEFLFSVEKDRTTQSYQAQEVIKQYKLQGKDFKKLDVRFDKPIVTQ